MKIRKICFLAGEYPTPQKPKAAVFYQNLIHQFAKMGIECRVIHPVPINYSRDRYLPDRTDVVDIKNSVRVHRPKCITLGAKKIALWNTAYISACLYTQSARTALNQMKWKPDVFYGHFISPAGIMAAKLSQETGIPAFIAYGESQPWSINSIGVKRTQRILSSINGFISVSSKNKDELISLNIAKEDEIRVFPNAVDNKVFYKRDKVEARKKMGWDIDKFIIAFVGHFNNRKGVLRLEEAISNIPGAFAAYAGSGNLIPCRAVNTIHVGNVSPEVMPWFLSAADVFVLPTLNEGCCNAIIEAMACGLPIISSDRDFNYDVLSTDNAVLINPENILDIRTAIITLKENIELRDTLSSRSIHISKSLSIQERASSILNWMESKC